MIGEMDYLIEMWKETKDRKIIKFIKEVMNEVNVKPIAS